MDWRIQVAGVGAAKIRVLEDRVEAVLDMS
jgi:hypothetical protein